MLRVRKLGAALLCASLANASLAADSVAVEDYGLLPFARSVAISPDGRHIAYIQRGDEGDYFVIADGATREIVGGADTRRIKARAAQFASNRHVILFGSRTARAANVRGKWENSSAFVYDLERRSMRQLLKDAEGLHPAQGGLGRIVGLDQEQEVVYIPAYVGWGSPSLDLLRVDLNSSRVKSHAKGNPYTTDWFVGRGGAVLAKEEYYERDEEHRVYAANGDDWRLIYSKVTSIPDVSFEAVSEDGKHLVFTETIDDRSAAFKMSLQDGAIEGPVSLEEQGGIDGLVTDGLSREFIGIRYSGLLPRYSYTSAEMQSHLGAIQAMFANSAVRRVSATADSSKGIFWVSGNEAAGDYVIFDARARTISRLASSYPNVSKDQIGAIKAIRYKARDGVPIYAIVTWPTGIEDRTNLPMLVLPHGGPEAYDSIRFDWWAQYFARSGYVILQPNFRGSTGSGKAFRDAGRGGWGKVMQDDITDGVTQMVKAGHVDPSRVCIMGASYGGYAALAGGAFTADTYRCVIAVAAVSDLPKMLRDVKFRAGSRHWVVSYWHEVIGDSKTEQEKLKDISPANFAEQFRAPVLLLHGKDDTVVPLAQSIGMARALKKAGKDVRFITLKGEDHWLSSSATRVELLQAIAGFLQEHNPADLE